MVLITRKKLLTNKYNELQEQLKLYLDTSILPNLIEYDLTDILYMISVTFPPNSNYRENLINLLEMNNIILDETSFENVFNIINDYLNWYRSL